MLVFIEGMVMRFLLLITCVIGIANGPVGLVVLYEQDVQDRVVELGYTKKEDLKKLHHHRHCLVYPRHRTCPDYGLLYNGAFSLWEGFWQMTAIKWIADLFDRLFIDWYWVGHTKAWIIPGTEDLRPYIPKKVLLSKWLGTIFLSPALSAVIA